MRILAIDPGPKRSAIIVWDGYDILEKGLCPNDEARDFVRRWMQPDQCLDAAVCERIASYGMSVGQDVFETCFVSGRFQQIADVAVSFYWLERREVKMHLCNSMKAKDTNIRQALIDRLGPAGTKKNPGPTYGIAKDLWAALAVAVTFYDTFAKRTPA